jgi:hypothetical protein
MRESFARADNNKMTTARLALSLVASPYVAPA